VILAATGYDLAALREREFPWAARGDAVYLNNASTGPLPQRALHAVSDFNKLRAEPFRLTDALQFETLAKSRALVARLVGASPGEIALATNTGFGLNLAASALPLGRGDVVLAPDLEFPANVYPWMAEAGRRGVEYRQLPARDGLLDEEGLLRALEDARVKAVTLSWVSFATGAVADLARIGAACRARGAWFVVDAIQGVGVLPLDLRRVPVDILACGAQKWLLSPWGTGFVYVREALARELEPHPVSWMSVRGSDDFTRLLDYDLTWRDDARRFEQLTLPFQDFAGMNASLELLHELGPAAVAAHVSALVDTILAWASTREDIALVTPTEPARRAGIVALRVPAPQATSARLQRAGVAHSLREGSIRLSPHLYNTRDEVEHALALLAEG